MAAHDRGVRDVFYLLVSFVDRWEHARTLTVVIVLMGVGEASWAIMQGLAWNVVEAQRHVLQPKFSCRISHVTWAIILSFGIYGIGLCRHFHLSWMSPVLWWLGLGSALCSLFLAMSIDPALAEAWLSTCRDGLYPDGSVRLEISRWLCWAVVLVGCSLPTPIRERVLAEHHQNPVSYARWQMWQGAVTRNDRSSLGNRAGTLSIHLSPLCVSGGRRDCPIWQSRPDSHTMIIFKWA